jgi:predicted component of type VI protein secretion system
MIKKLIAAGALSAGLVAGVVGIAGAAGASTAHPVSATSHHAKAAEPDPKGEVTSPEPDGPGGHADPAGQNVDHQFSGVE